jgi:hypothetical protein
MGEMGDIPPEDVTPDVLADLIAPTQVNCTHYCAQVDLVCPEGSDQAIWPNVIECNQQCESSSWAAASDDEWLANSLACRIRVAESITATDAESRQTNCSIAGPTGGGVCGDWCEVYCAEAIKRCSLFGGDDATCRTECEAWPVVEKAWITHGNSVQCRLTYVSMVAQDFADKLAFCAHARADSTVCVDVSEQPGNTCDDAIVVDMLPFSHAGDTGRLDDHYSTAGSCGVGAFRGTTQPDAAYQLTTTTAGIYTVALKTQGPGPAIIYATTDCAEMQSACFDVSGDLAGGNSYGFQLAENTTYHLIVDGLLLGDVGAYTLTVAGP